MSVCGQIYGYWALRHNGGVRKGNEDLVGPGRLPRIWLAGSDPVGDDWRLAGVGHGADPGEAVGVAAGDPFVLAQVLVPGGDDELLQDTVGVRGILPEAPGGGPGAAAAEAGVPQGRAQVIAVSLPGA